MVARQANYMPEAFEGTKIVQWYNNIERQLTRMLEENEAARNFNYADQIRTFLKTWRENEVTGSMNRETILVLKAASEQLSVQAWNLANYFSNLKTQLAKLIASEEQLPRVATEPGDKMGGPGGGAPGGSLPPLSPEFGPEGEEPPGMGGPEPAGGMPPEEEMPPPGEEGEGEGEEEEKKRRPGAPPPPRAEI
jgi:hypothetical protein